MTLMTNSVESVLETIGISIASVGQREISCHCPFHKDRHPSFSINAHTGLWVCFQCGDRGTLEMLITQVADGEEVHDAKEALRQIRSRSVGRPKETKVEDDPEPTEYAAMVYARYEQFGDPPKWAYENRFLSLQRVRQYEIKWNRGWVIPVWDPVTTGRPSDLWGWQFKRMDFVSNYPPGIHKSQTLFGLRQFPGGTGVLVESPLDVVRLASAGYRCGLATFGAMVSRAQLDLVLERCDRIVVALDNDSEGRKQGKKIYRYLARLMPAEMLHYVDGIKDPGEADTDELHVMMEDARVPR